MRFCIPIDPKLIDWSMFLEVVSTVHLPMSCFLRFETPHLDKVNNHLALCLKVGLSRVSRKRQSAICGKVCFSLSIFHHTWTELQSPCPFQITGTKSASFSVAFLIRCCYQPRIELPHAAMTLELFVAMWKASPDKITSWFMSVAKLPMSAEGILFRKWGFILEIGRVIFS